MLYCISRGCKYGSGVLTVNTTTIDEKYNNNSNLIDIYCGGCLACASESDFKGNNSFSIDIIDKDNYNSSINSFDIHCDGHTSCQKTNLSGADKLYCGGYRGCWESTISSVTTIIGNGRSGLGYATISKVFGDLYCISHSACYVAKIEGISGNVFGFGYRSMREISITNSKFAINPVIEKIYAIGYQTGRLMQVYNVKSLYATGHEVLVSADIIGIRNLYVNGTDALKRSSIITGLSINDNNTIANYTSTVVLDIGGTNQITYDVVCSAGDECLIYCRLNTSCTNMVLKCNGVCYLNCDNSGYIQCPNDISGNGTWGFENPIHMYIPTVNPPVTPTESANLTETETPTTGPTDVTISPSVEPSAELSWQPSARPQPSLQPSLIPTTAQNGSANDSDGVDINVLILMVIICCFCFCAVSIISVTFMVSSYRKKNWKFEEKKLNMISWQ